MKKCSLLVCLLLSSICFTQHLMAQCIIQGNNEGATTIKSITINNELYRATDNEVYEKSDIMILIDEDNLTLPIKLQSGSNRRGKSMLTYWRIWIDANNDKHLTDNEIIYDGQGHGGDELIIDEAKLDNLQPKLDTELSLRILLTDSRSIKENHCLYGSSRLDHSMKVIDAKAKVLKNGGRIILVSTNDGFQGGCDGCYENDGDLELTLYNEYSLEVNYLNLTKAIIKYSDGTQSGNLITTPEDVKIISYIRPTGQTTPALGTLPINSLSSAWGVNIAIQYDPDELKDMCGQLCIEGEYFLCEVQQDFLATLDIAPFCEAGGLSIGSSDNAIHSFPNPFQTKTNITYQLPSREKVKIVLYDSFGNTINTLLDDIQEAGIHTLTVDGNSLMTGTYYCVVITRSSKITYPILKIE